MRQPSVWKKTPEQLYRYSGTTLKKTPYWTADHTPCISIDTKVASTTTHEQLDWNTICRWNAGSRPPSGQPLLSLEPFHFPNKPKMRVKEQHTFVFALPVEVFVCWFAQKSSLNLSQLISLLYTGREIYQGRTKILEVFHGKWEEVCHSSQQQEWISQEQRNTGT